MPTAVKIEPSLKALLNMIEIRLKDAIEAIKTAEAGLKDKRDPKHLELYRGFMGNANQRLGQLLKEMTGKKYTHIAKESIRIAFAQKLINEAHDLTFGAAVYGEVDYGRAEVNKRMKRLLNAQLKLERALKEIRKTHEELEAAA